MGLFSSGGTTTTTGTSTNTSNLSRSSKRTNPQWVEDIAKGFGGEVADLAGVDPRSFVPGTSPLQAKAFGDVAGLGGMAEAFGGAMDMTAGAGNAAAPRTEFVKSSGMIGEFMDPYLKDVVDAAMADFDFGAGNTRAAQDLDIARSGAFGGSGSALAKSATEGEILRGRGGLSAGLRSDGWRTALAAAQNEANRKQGANDLNAGLYAGQLDRAINAGQGLSNIASTFGGEKRADAATTLAAGGMQRDIAGEEQRAGLDFLRERQDLFAGTMPELFGGEDMTGTASGTMTSNSKSKTKQGKSLMDQAGQMAQIAALFASDVRLKRDIERVGTREDGLGIYLYRYLWSPVLYLGVMAQEVLKVKPWAVVTMPNGFYAVDYNQI